MIAYMPFTFIPDNLIDPLTKALGPIAVWQPMDGLVPAPMQAAAEKGLLALRYPAQLDQGLLARSHNQFAAWADLHKGRGGDLSGFFRSGRQAEARMQESAQFISAQIRSSDPDETGTAESPLLQAALFLSLAHRYDQQQDELNLQLGSVASLECKFGQILGDTGEEKGFSGADLTARKNEAPFDPGLYMTDQRIEAWARLAAEDPSFEGRLFLTTSPAIWESLIDRLPEAVPAVQIDLGPERTGHIGPDALAELTSALQRAEDPTRVCKDRTALQPGQTAGWTLSLHVLVGWPPHKVLSRLMKAPDRAQTLPPAVGPLNTIFGYLRIGPVCRRSSGSMV